MRATTSREQVHVELCTDRSAWLPLGSSGERRSP
jgi:hypothetical protein